MDIHKPKPWHGVREFLKEYVIIVVGVLTALGAEQGVEWLHWRHVTAEAHDAIAFDLRRIIGSAGQKDAESACVGNRLTDLADMLDKAEVTRRLPPLGFGGAPQSAAWNLRSWSAITSGQTLAHIPNRDQLILTEISYYADGLHAARDAEGEDWAVLTTTVGAGRPVSEAELAALRSALGRAYRHALYVKTASRQIATLVVRSGYLSQKQIDASFREGVEKAKSSETCQPRWRPPARSSDLFHQQYLFDPVKRPGQREFPATVGVGGSITTER